MKFVIERGMPNRIAEVELEAQRTHQHEPLLEAVIKDCEILTLLEYNPKL